MLHLITGGSGSGKSAYAEAQVLAAGERRRIYIATMMPYGEDGRRRVERHRRMRAQKQFDTVECYTGLETLRLKAQSTVLLECMSNLVANEMFEKRRTCGQTAEIVLAGVRNLIKQTDRLFIVTNEVFSDGIAYDEQTQEYLRCLGKVNCELAKLADTVTEVVYGIPVNVKTAAGSRISKKSGEQDETDLE